MTVRATSPAMPDAVLLSPLRPTENRFFVRELALHEEKYLAGANPRKQSGFGRDASDWERFRRPVVAPIDRDGAFLDIDCANGLLMESVVGFVITRVVSGVHR